MNKRPIVSRTNSVLRTLMNEMFCFQCQQTAHRQSRSMRKKPIPGRLIIVHFSANYILILQ